MSEKFNLSLLMRTIIVIALLLILSAIVIVIDQSAGKDVYQRLESTGFPGNTTDDWLISALIVFAVLVITGLLYILVKKTGAIHRELQDSRKLQEKLLVSNRDESIRKQLTDNASRYVNNCEELINKPVFPIYLRYEDRQVYISINDAIRNPVYYDEPAVESTLNSFPSMMRSRTGSAGLHLKRIRSQLNHGVVCVCHLIKYLEIDVLTKLWDSRIRSLIRDCETVNIISGEEAEHFRRALRGAKQISQKD